MTWHGALLVRAFALLILLGLTSSAHAENEFFDGTKYGSTSSSTEAQDLLKLTVDLRKESEDKATNAGSRVSYRFGDLHFRAENPTAFMNWVSMIKIMKENAKTNPLNVHELGDLLNWDAGRFKTVAGDKPGEVKISDPKFDALEKHVTDSGDKEAIRIFSAWKKAIETEIPKVRARFDAEKGLSDEFKKTHLDNWVNFGAMEAAFAKVMSSEIPGKDNNFFHLTGNHGIHYNDAIRQAQREWDAKRDQVVLFSLLKMTGERGYLSLIGRELELSSKVERPESEARFKKLVELGTALRSKLRPILNAKFGEKRAAEILGSNINGFTRNPKEVIFLMEQFNELLKDRANGKLVMDSIGAIQAVLDHRHSNSSDFKVRNKLLADMEEIPHMKIGPYPYDSKLDADGLAVSRVLRATKEGVAGHTLLTDLPEETAVVSRTSGKFASPAQVKAGDYSALKGERGDAEVHYPLPKGENLDYTRNVFYSLKKTTSEVPVFPASVVNTLYHGDDHSRNRTIGHHLDPNANREQSKQGFLVIDTGTSGSWVNAQEGRFSLVKTVDDTAFHLNLDTTGKGESPMTVLTPTQTNIGLPVKMAESSDNLRLIHLTNIGRIARTFNASQLLQGIGKIAFGKGSRCPKELRKISPPDEK